MTFPYDQARLQALFSEVDSRIDDLGKVATAASQVQRRSRGLSEQDLADAFTEDGVLPGRVDFAKFVDRRFVNDINKG